MLMSQRQKHCMESSNASFAGHHLAEFPQGSVPCWADDGQHAWPSRSSSAPAAGTRNCRKRHCTPITFTTCSPSRGTRTLNHLQAAESPIWSNLLVLPCNTAVKALPASICSKHSPSITTFHLLWDQGWGITLAPPSYVAVFAGW